MTVLPSDYEFHFTTGRLCLDFAATLGSRRTGPFERWREPADLGRWLVEAGLSAPAPKVSETDLEHARTLREAVYNTVSARRRDAAPDPVDIACINDHAAGAIAAPQLDAEARTCRFVSSAPLQAALSAVARDAVDLVTGPDIARARECDEHSCSVLFVDTSRPGRRRWCSMNRCGNRTKKAAFRRRHAAT